MAVVSRPQQGAARPNERVGALARPLPALTGVRFVAAFAVMVFHYGWYNRVTHTMTPADTLLNSLNIAVNLFFVLSGFILVYAYVTPDGTLRVRPRSFWVVRVARVYPVYLLSLVVAALPIGPWSPLSHDALWRTVAVLTLSQAWVPHLDIVWNSPAWTLSVEAFFYFTFPFIAPPFLQAVQRYPYRILGISWLASMAPIGVWFLLTHQTSGDWTVYIAHFPLFHIPEFLVGMVFGWLYLHRVSIPANALTRYLSGSRIIAILMVTIGIVLTCSPAVPRMLEQAGGLDLFMGLLLYTLARDRKGMATLLSIPAIALLGEASYGLYVLHMPLWALLNTAHTTLPPQGDLRSQVFTVFYCVGAILASVICFRVIEQPARRAIRHAFA